MPLSSGTRLGPYQIESVIGTGGMGEVYRAHDRRLNRSVAVKVLPPHLSAPEDRKRFEREARTISSFAHPHICALHDIGHDDGIDYMVMEYLEGETLEQRLRKGPLPIDLALRYAIEIADALHQAHRRGIVHRDLKPGNVMLTKTGTKLLDFGLAKVVEPSSDPSASSTARTASAPLTADHTILGTLPYMAPEQVEGRDVDMRADVFALGAVLYEMVTGRRAFTGETRAALTAAILTADLALISSLQPSAAPRLDRVVAMCLAKNRDERWQSAHDLMVELQWTMQAETSRATTGRSRIRERWFWGAAVAALSLGIGALWLSFARRAIPDAQPARLSVTPPQEDAVIQDGVLSPDGRWLAITASLPGENVTLWLRRIDATRAQFVSGTEDASAPFWSPDGKFVAFFARGKLMKIEVPDGQPQPVCEAPAGERGTWAADGTILFGNISSEGILRVPTSGGTPTRVTKPTEIAGLGGDIHPLFLPDGRHFLFARIAPSDSISGIYAGSLDGMEPVRLLADVSSVAYAPPGYLLFVRRGHLIAQTFDLASLRLKDDPRQLASGIADNDFTLYDFSVSSNGVLAYRAVDRNSRLAWVDRAGNVLQKVSEPADYVHVDLAPDDSRAAVEVIDPQTGNHNVSIIDLVNGNVSRLTFGSFDSYPIWSPDGTRVVYATSDEDRLDLVSKAASGAGAEQPLVTSGPGEKWPTCWSSNGYLVFEGSEWEARPDIWMLKLDGSPDASPYQEAPGWENGAQVSPDGRWIAYHSDPEIYVQRFPVPDGKWQISRNGGYNPRWGRDGMELFYMTDAGVMSVDVNADEAFYSSAPRLLFSATGIKTYKNRFQYAVARDGKRFLANIPESRLSTVTVVTNWTATLE